MELGPLNTPLDSAELDAHTISVKSNVYKEAIRMESYIEEEVKSKKTSSPYTSDDNTRLHFRVTRFIMEAGIKLGMHSVPVATACTIYHKFFCETNPDVYDPYLVAMSSVYLAGKVEEQHLRTRDIINVSHRYFNPHSEPLELDSKFWELRDSIVQCELVILRLLNFHVCFQHPHKYLLHYLVSLKNWMNRHVWERTPLTVTAWALLRDVYHSNLCLRYQPQHIAIAILYVTLQCYGVEVPGDAEAEKQWWQVFSDDITMPIILGIMSELMQTYGLDSDVS